jgi:hypothetical protein
VHIFDPFARPPAPQTPRSCRHVAARWALDPVDFFKHILFLQMRTYRQRLWYSLAHALRQLAAALESASGAAGDASHPSSASTSSSSITSPQPRGAVRAQLMAWARQLRDASAGMARGDEAAAGTGGVGRRRVVYVNRAGRTLEAASAAAARASGGGGPSPPMRDNRVINTKHTRLSFLPTMLREQFSAPMNLYFLLIACLQLWPAISPVRVCWGGAGGGSNDNLRPPSFTRTHPSLLPTRYSLLLLLR